jgi:hypothetical protein
MVDIERAKTHPNPKPASVELKHGMTSTVGIRAGHRVALKYLANGFTGCLAGR